MKREIAKRQRAITDMLYHFVYIGEDNYDAAERFLKATQDAFEKLAEMPGLGALRDFENPRYADVRSWPITGFENFLIFYHATDREIDVLRVLHGARDLDRIFSE